MAIVENIASEDGDIIRINTDVPVVGIISLSSFMDTTVGETGSVYFTKTFRYSTNAGLTWSSWLDLTTINIQNIVIERVDYFIIEYRYKKVGVPDTLEFDNVTLQGNFSPLTYPVFDSMVFHDYFTPNDINVLRWAINVLEKLYKDGVIAKYIQRNRGTDDKDFVSYWFTITHFFAILVYYARGFEHIPNSIRLMKEFVKGRDLYMRGNPDVEELYYVYNNYIAEIQKRGSEEIYLSDADSDGELLRLLDYIEIDEFLFAFTTCGELGWCIGQSSPLYDGADNIANLIKGYEFTEDVVDLSKYPLINEDCISLVSGAIQITNVPDGEVAGIGLSTVQIVEGGYSTYLFDDTPLSDDTYLSGEAFIYYEGGIGIDLIYPEDLEKAVVIDSSLAYEVSFRVEKSEGVPDLTFGVSVFDANRESAYTERITDNFIDNRFFSVKTLNKTGTEYWVRGVIHAYNTDVIPGDKLNIGFGQGLKFNPEKDASVYLVPVIVVENNTGAVLTDVVRIRDIKIRPASLWFSRGLLSARNMIIGFMQSRSTEYSNAEIERIVNEKLIPYNCSTILKFL